VSVRTGDAVPASAGALATRGITKRFGSVVAVDAVDLDLPRGSFFSLLGPSGCGKTTLLRIIAGLEQPDSGTIEVDGQDITRLPPERRPFNMVFQRYALFPHLSVFDNVAFGLTTARSERPAREVVRRRVGEMLELVGLSGYELRWPSQLSGGQQQRVAVARALIRRPRVLLLDEPMSALDRNVRHQVREELLRIHSELGTTFLLVTHDQDEALSISGIVGLMNQGRLEQVTAPETLYRHPATLFAARFVGAGTFLDTTIVGRNGSSVDVDLAGIRFAASDAGATASEATVLLRPEDLRVVATGAGRLDGRVMTCAFFGSYYELTASTACGMFRLRDTVSRGPGDGIGIDWPASAGIAYPRTGVGSTPATDAEGAEPAAGRSVDHGR
jgi:ABC-type Fe3+/spermidine/putrescine transport system ATPase subunit